MGLTTYNSPENFEDAKRDLIKHVQGQQVEILYDKDDNPIAFGVYALHESQAYFEIARIVHPDFQDKKLGKYFVLSGCQRNAELQYLVSSTQNQRAFFSIQSALGKNNMIADSEIISQFNKKLREHELEMINFSKNIPYPVTN